jgi:hypothetical protein
MTNQEVCADKNSVCVRDGASREEILCNVSSSTKDERHLTSGQDTGNNAQPSDKPAWLDHIGRPQQIMKIRHCGMVSLLLRGYFQINQHGWTILAGHSKK